MLVSGNPMNESIYTNGDAVIISQKVSGYLWNTQTTNKDKML
jgi:hypothetical protein